MSEPGRRERKKQQMRDHIAQCSALLFGQRGYESVTVAEIAEAADVSLQTVYNHFPTKRHLLLDREEELSQALERAVLDRASHVSPAAAVRPVVVGELALLRTRTSHEAAGDLPVLAAQSPEVRRYALEARDRQADRLAQALRSTGVTDGELDAKALAAAIVSVLQSVVDQVGRRLVEGESPGEVADDLEQRAADALDSLEAWFG